MLELCPPSPPQLLSWVPVQHYCITRLSLLYSYYLIIITGLIKPVRTRLKMVFRSKFPILAIFRNVHKVCPDTDLNNICMFLKPCMGKLGNVVAETLGFLQCFPVCPPPLNMFLKFLVSQFGSNSFQSKPCILSYISLRCRRYRVSPSLKPDSVCTAGQSYMNYINFQVTITENVKLTGLVSVKQINAVIFDLNMTEKQLFKKKFLLWKSTSSDLYNVYI